MRDVVAPLALFAYAAPFSFAYVRIDAAVGALVGAGLGEEAGSGSQHPHDAGGLCLGCLLVGKSAKEPGG